MAALSHTEEQEIRRQFQELLEGCTFIRSESDRSLIVRAFELAFKAHSSTRRKSGEPYILHPLAVSKIIAFEIGLGATSIAAALLHDVVEDTDVPLDLIRRDFGERVAIIVNGLTKISGVFDKDSSLQAENFRKMLITLSEDVRVIIIKLADRLHNMRTLDALSEQKRFKIASETIYLYAPLAHRMGLYAIKQELEDLSLKYRHPHIYQQVLQQVQDNEETRARIIDEFVAPVREKLTSAGYQFDITGRPKSIYSIYYKMQHKGIPFEEIYDLLAVRIVFDPEPGIPEKNQCWSVYSLITDLYTPKQDRIRDWVSLPKANGYEALHVTVMGPRGKWVEVQIRTRRMDEIAEKGFAAHWKYKNSTLQQESELDKWLKKVREMLNEPNADAIEFVNEFKMNLFSSEIQVFTPKGHIKTLPVKATALDFAYEIHSEIGNSAMAAKVNYKLVPLNHVLNSGDQVEIITSDKKRIQREWLDYVVTAKAKGTIMNAIKSENKHRTEKGKEMLEARLKEFNLAPSARILKKLMDAHKVANKDELYSKIGMGLVGLDDLQKILRKNTPNKWIRYWQLQIFGTKSKPSRDVQEAGDEAPTGGAPAGLAASATSATSATSAASTASAGDELPVSFRTARCCNPIPGDDVIGYKSPGGVVSIHKSRCPNAVRMVANHGDMIVPVKWTMSTILSFLVRIEIKGIDRYDIYSQITRSIAEGLNANIRTINMSGHDGIFEGMIELYVRNTRDLESLITRLKEIKGIESVKRLDIRQEEDTPE